MRINNQWPAGTMVHELSHHLEADRETFNRAVAFLSRRTAGDMIEVINERGDLGRRDKFRNTKGRANAYPGRVYEATRSTDAEGWHRATLREAVTGAEAEWDRHKWSGDKRFVSRLRTQQEGVVPPSAVGRTVTACQDGGQYDQLVILAGFGCPPRP